MKYEYTYFDRFRTFKIDISVSQFIHANSLHALDILSPFFVISTQPSAAISITVIMNAFIYYFTSHVI